MLLTRSRIYYGWVLVLALSATEAVSWGVLYYAYAVFLTPMQTELGWTRAETTGAFSLALLISGLVAVPVGRWLDRHGPRLLMTLGSILAALLVLAWARVDSLLGLYAIWLGIGLTMAAVLYEPAFSVVATWFHRRRGRALTVLTFLAGFASVIFIPLAGWLVETRGWRDALVSLAIVLALVTIPIHALLLRRRPEDLGLAPDGASPVLVGMPPERSVAVRTALRDRSFWRLGIAFFLAIISSTALTVHLVPFLIDRGFDAGSAAWAAGAVGIAALPGRIIFTPLGDILPRRFVAAAIFLAQALGIAALLVFPGSIGIFMFAALFGAGFGAITPARVALVADAYGAANYATISGVLAAIILASRAIAPVGVGALYDAIGGYPPIFWGLGAISALAAAIVCTTRSAPASG